MKFAFSLAVTGLMACAVAGNMRADVVAFDDFEGLTLGPFLVAAGSIGDGTDWTDQIRTGTAREWTIDNSGMGGTGTSELAYFGWTAMDVDSWIDEQGVQVGRTSLGAGTNNTALVADPDAWDDYTSGNAAGDFNSYIMREYDLTGFDETTLSITFDYEFYSYATQTGTVEVSFDGGSTWQMILLLDSTTVPNSTPFVGPGTFVAGTDFSADSSNMLLRIGCLTAGNDWWFAVDNIDVSTTDGYSDFEDFEGLTLVPFTDAGSIGDGTDYTKVIPNWDIDNSNNLGFCEEEAFDGWSAMDVFSWADEQGGQGRTNFNLISPNNTVLVADGDAFYDYDFDFNGVDPAPPEALNTYISRTYDMSGYDNCTIQIDFLYEFRVENQQLGNAEVSFDGGSTWQTLVVFDNSNNANGDFLTGQQISTAIVDFVPTQSNTMILRFGYLNADNNWWYAVDEVQVQADPINYVKGDADGSGLFNNADIAAFVLALTDPAGFASTYPGVDPNVVLDMDCSGGFNNADISGFVNLLFGN